MKANRYNLVSLFAALIFFTPVFTNGQVTVEKSDSHWILKVEGSPFEIHGATFGYEDDPENYGRYLKDLKSMGVNSIRTWATGENTPRLLDEAEKQGIKVMVGIWMRHGRPGMEDDDSFDYLTNTQGMEDMYENAVKTVESFKDHPAVLTWGVGNEVYLNMATDPEKEAYSKLLEKICRKIKELDPDHPIASVEAWTFGLEWWQKHVPSLDIYGLNSYGPGVGLLQDELEKRNIDKPYIITEFGVTGEWDRQEDDNGVKTEPSDAEKFDAIAKGVPEWIQSKSKNLGVYVFHYSNGKEFIAPWLFTHVDSYKRPQYWAIRKAFTGKDPINLVPEIRNFEISVDKTPSGTWIPVNLQISDHENEEVKISFHYNQRTGSRKRRDQVLPLNFRGNLNSGYELELPPVDGAVKVYVHAVDSYGNMGISSASVIVIDEDAALKKYLVPKAELPFYVYQDSDDLPYVASGYMGNYKAIEVDVKSTKEVYSGNTAIRISYKDKGNWYGVGFVDPANDWGEILGGYDISGAKTFSFWAKSNFQMNATVGFGLIENDKPFPDTSKESIDIVLTNEWKKYTIKIKKQDMSCIRSGLVFTANGNGFNQEIYIDEVVFE